MSKLNIYETSWIDLVFENRNKDYGAYHLRQENTKTSLFALFMGVLFLAAVISVPVIYNRLNPGHQIPSLVPDSPPIVTVDMTPYVPPQAKTEEPAMAQAKKPITENIITSSQLINPEVVKTALATTEDIATNDQLKNIQGSNTTEATGTGTGTSTSTGTETGINTSNISETAIIPSAVLDKMPEFPGGIKKF